jgi:DNA-binding transcriptional ArsR family regulator
MELSPNLDLCNVLGEENVAAGLAALSHPARLSILRHLACCPACCCRDVVERLDLAQSTVSQHLKVLVEAGLVRFSPDRQRSRYELDRAALKNLSSALSALVDECCSGR